jgi:hypothetical protein
MVMKDVHELLLLENGGVARPLRGARSTKNVRQEWAIKTPMQSADRVPGLATNTAPFGARGVASRVSAQFPDELLC